MNCKKIENEFSFSDQENVKLTGSRRTASARAGGTSISHFLDRERKIHFLFPIKKMLGGEPMLQNGEFFDIFCRLLWTSLDFVKTFTAETRLYYASAASNRMSGKTLWAEIFAAKVGNLGHFCVFFDFSPVFRK